MRCQRVLFLRRPVGRHRSAPNQRRGLMVLLIIISNILIIIIIILDIIPTAPRIPPHRPPRTDKGRGVMSLVGYLLSYSLAE